MASYILTYDVSTASLIHEQLSAFVKASRHITQWSQPFVGCYLLKSDTPLNTIATSFAEFFGKKTLHVIAPIEPSHTSGILPQYLWEWINRPEPSILAGLLASFPPAKVDN